MVLETGLLLEAGVIVAALLLAIETGCRIGFAISERIQAITLTATFGAVVFGSTILPEQVGSVGWISELAENAMVWLGVAAIVAGSMYYSATANILLNITLAGAGFAWLISHSGGRFSALLYWQNAFLASIPILGLLITAYNAAPGNSPALHCSWKIITLLKQLVGVGGVALLLVAPAIMETRKLRFSISLPRFAEQEINGLIGIGAFMVAGYIWNCRNVK